MAKCSACGSRILFGGEQWGHWTCCDAGCVSNLKVAFVDEAVDRAVVDRSVEDLFHGACPGCGGAGPVDVYRATTVTGMVVVFQTVKRAVVGCSSCGRKLRAKAALHCLFLGWWGPKAALCNLFYFPSNLLSALFTRAPDAPSPALKRRVKEVIAENSLPQLVAAIRSKAESGTAQTG